MIDTSYAFPSSVKSSHTLAGIDMENIGQQRRDFISISQEHTSRTISKQAGKRCGQCWLDSREACICRKLPKLTFIRTKFLIYQDYKEFLNPGDDAKLLMCTSREQTQLVLYPHQDQILLDSLEGRTCNDVCILFPSETSLTLDEYCSQCLTDSGIDWKFELSGRTRCSEKIAHTDFAGSVETDGDETLKPLLTVILIDAVWRHARKMANRLRDIAPWVPRVQLSPQQLSVYARKQTQPDRICTIEACALFLSEMGASHDLCEQLIDCVKINKSALKRKKGHTQPKEAGESIDSRLSTIVIEAQSGPESQISDDNAVGGII